MVNDGQMLGSNSITIFHQSICGLKEKMDVLTLWGPINEIKEKTLHFIQKRNLNSIQNIIFTTKDKKNYNLLQNFCGFILKPLRI
jgi:hypothetical protein